MQKMTERQLERRFCAMEKRRDAISAAARDPRHSAATKMALARASDALTEALRSIQAEVGR